MLILIVIIDNLFLFLLQHLNALSKLWIYHGILSCTVSVGFLVAPLGVGLVTNTGLYLWIYSPCTSWDILVGPAVECSFNPFDDLGL